MTKKRKEKKSKTSKSSASSQDNALRRPSKLKRSEYEAELEKLQIELVKLQSWVKHSGARIVVVFEGATRPAKVG